MENNLFQQAKDAVNRLTSATFGSNATTQDKEAAWNTIQSAYTDCTPEEREQLQQLEQRLQDNRLSNASDLNTFS